MYFAPPKPLNARNSTLTVYCYAGQTPRQKLRSTDRLEVGLCTRTLKVMFANDKPTNCSSLVTNWLGSMCIVQKTCCYATGLDCSSVIFNQVAHAVIFSLWWLQHVPGLKSALTAPQAWGCFGWTWLRFWFSRGLIFLRCCCADRTIWPFTGSVSRRRRSRTGCESAAGSGRARRTTRPARPWVELKSTQFR